MTGSANESSGDAGERVDKMGRADIHRLSNLSSPSSKFVIPDLIGDPGMVGK